MENKRGLFVLFVSLFTLFSCSNENHVQDLKSYIEKLKKTMMTVQNKKDMTAVPVPAPVSYRSSRLRAPFEMTTASYTEKGTVNPLNAYPLNMLRFTGVLDQDNKVFALVFVPNGKMYQVAVGDVIGDHYGKISRIDNDHMDVIEEVVVDETHKEERLVKMPLRD